MCHNQFWLDDKKTLNDMRNMKMPSVLLKKIRQMFIIGIYQNRFQSNKGKPTC